MSTDLRLKKKNPGFSSFQGAATGTNCEQFGVTNKAILPRFFYIGFSGAQTIRQCELGFEIFLQSSRVFQLIRNF